MKRPGRGLFLLLAGVVFGQAIASPRPAGTIDGWGIQVAVEPNAWTGVASVSSGYSHELAVHSDGTIVAWGDNAYRQCVLPSPNAGFAAVSAGEWFSMGLKRDGSIVVWGGAMM